VAVVFFRKDLMNSSPASEQPAANAAGPTARPAPRIAPAPAAPPPPAMPPRGQYRPIKARTAIRATGQHVVQPGETLFSLAQRYYGDGARAHEIYQANRHVLSSPDQVPPGTVLVLDLGE
jgi:nucleoid-associated protein YgaU